MEKLIISSSAGGLGNRLKCLISILRLSKELDRRPVLYWPKNVLMGCNFNVLFKKSPFKKDNLKEINEKELKNILKDDYDFYREWLDNIYSKKKVLLLQCWRYILLPKEIKKGFAKEYPTLKGNNIDFEFERIPQEIKKTILKEIKKFKPSKEIKKEVEKYTKKYDFKNMIGVHVRRTDFQTSPDGRGKISDNMTFFKRMNEFVKKDNSIKFFLCTDSKETEKEFKKIFGEKIISSHKSDWNMSSYQASKDSLVDLLLLSKTKNILGTYLSTFTEIAWWFGNCLPAVEIIGNGKFKEKKQVLKNLNKENVGLKGILKKFKIILYNLKLIR